MGHLRPCFENQFAKVLVESDEQAVFVVSAGENGGVSDAGSDFANPENVMSIRAQFDDAIFWQIFVGAEPHEKSHGEGENFFLVQPLLSASGASADLFVGEVIVAHDLFLRPTLRNESEDKFHGKAGAANDGFPDENSRIGGDVFLPVHAGERLQRKMWLVRR